jgi:hypothetical protein
MHGRSLPIEMREPEFMRLGIEAALLAPQSGLATLRTALL